MDREMAAYARVSTERQAETQTIEQQIERLRAYTQERGWPLPNERIYRDDGHSGARLGRPALDRLRDAVARGDVDTLPDHQPRSARPPLRLPGLAARGIRACRLLSRVPGSAGDPRGALVTQIRGARGRIRARGDRRPHAAGSVVALRAGRILPWSTPPYGYRLDPLHPRDPGGVRIEEAEAEIIRQPFAWHVEDELRLYATVQRLIAENVPTPTGRPFWNPSSVHKILCNQTYAGLTYGNQKQQCLPGDGFP